MMLKGKQVSEWDVGVDYSWCDKPTVVEVVVVVVVVAVAYEPVKYLD